MSAARWPTAPPARKSARCSCRWRSIAACRPASMPSAMPRKYLPNSTRSNRKYSAMKDKWALVTGATAGLGLAVAESLAGAGANIVLHDLVAPKEAADRLGARFGVKVVAAEADLTQRMAIETMMAALPGRCGPVDILVNNAVVRHFAAVEHF